MKILVDNWAAILVAVIFIIYFVLSGKKSVKEWLLYAVCIAERELGGGTGRLKLKYVYDQFVSTYPIISKLIPFAVFSMWVDEALKEMRAILETNLDIRAYIEE